MIRPDDAQKQLKEFKVKDGKGRRMTRASELKGSQKRIALGILGCEEDGKYVKGDTARGKHERKAMKELEGLQPAQRAEIFEALFPKLGATVERAWQLYGERPYQDEYDCRAFRAPGHPEVVRESRCGWLDQILESLKGYEHDVVWLAAWAPHVFQWWSESSIELLAAGIDMGGETGQEVFDILCASARGEHPVGIMGAHVSGALLCASRPEGWEYVERMLLAAQREEGLRQAILERVDRAHPEAFRRMLRLILEHNLLRFSATLLALDVWFGFHLEVTEAKLARTIVEQVSHFLENPIARQQALEGSDARAIYLALWAVAFENAVGAVEAGAKLLQHPQVEARYAAALLLAQLQLPAARPVLISALDDPDLRVAVTALEGIEVDESDSDAECRQLFEVLSRLVMRMPKKEKVIADLVWPGKQHQPDQETVAGMLVEALGKRSPTELIPYLPMMQSWTRSTVVEKLAKVKGEEKALARDTILAMAGDAAQYVREEAFKALGKHQITSEEAPRLEKLLTRKAADLRRGLLTLLLKQGDEAALASADRLTAARDLNQRTAGLELLQQLAKGDRQPPACRERAVAYRAAQKTITEPEEKLLEALCEEEKEAQTHEAGLGLLDPRHQTPAVRPPDVPGLQLESPAAQAILESLDQLAHAHRETAVSIIYHSAYDEDDEDEAEDQESDSENMQLLGDLSWGLPSPNYRVPIEKDLARFPLREVWEEWYAARGSELRDADGLELLRAHALIQDFAKKKLQHRSVVEGVLEWLIRLHPAEGTAEFLVGAAETVFARVPQEKIDREPNPKKLWQAFEWRANKHRGYWLEQAREHRSHSPGQWQAEHHVRLWRLVHWLDRPTPKAPRLLPSIEEALPAWKVGGATEADLIDLLVGPRGNDDGDFTYYGSHYSELRNLTGKKGSPLFEQYPGLREIVLRCRDRVVEVELGRGELPSPATPIALSLRTAGGLDKLVRLVAALGKGTLVRGWIYADQSKGAIFSKLIRSTFPEEGDTPERFAEEAKKARIPERRLVEVAMYAPQWAQHVETALGWPLFAEAVWWIHAHTKDQQWSIDEDIREAWAVQTSERTPLSAQSLIDGAVDVEWFHRVYGALGPDRWTAVDAGAKYASGGGGHKRAQLFADAMLGRADRAALVTQIKEKRTQDSLRALGLLPLPEDPALRSREVLERYRIIQDYIQGSRQFGSQRQVSEKLAASIAMENLARTAGYADPIRLEWAMEARAIEDLAGGSLSATAAEVTVTLSVNDWGEPDLSIMKNGKALKAIPPAAKKDPAVAALVIRKRDVQKQASRMRLSLENAMCRGDHFTGDELATLSGHPVLAPMLRNLVFLMEREGRAHGLGYPVDGGTALAAYDDRRSPVAGSDRLRLAHPHDLLASGAWHQWQHDCFRRERIQPFKQVFRELYVLNPAEQQGGVRSVRYAGHQVQNRRAMALLGKRGWVSNYEEGDVRRTFHAEGLTAWLEFDAGYTTPAEVEGLTVQHVGFTRRGEWSPLKLEEVPPRIFSEVMRDVDLVVSVAHAGGIDPEATQSSVEMRAALLRETFGLLKIENVRLNNTHALIDGQLSKYSVHLGSAVVHRQPGGHLCIVPVHSQHRGRIFLPFADNDPRTAEVVSKVITLARDNEIKDPTILAQIYG